MDTLRNHFLIAMPALDDPNFNETVTYICQHDAEGAVGIVVNRPGDVTFGEVCERLGIEATDTIRAQQRVLAGGPVEPERGFVLHSASQEFESTLAVSDDISLTASRDVLEALASGQGPEQAVLALGYAGWSAGQLEAELAANAWLSVEADGGIIFTIPFQQRWAAAANLIGVDIRGISSYSGHA